jgi:hypothetical protein
MRSERELLTDCLDRLNRLDIPYMLVGSMASNYWGVPRSTHDLDFVLAFQPEDDWRLAEAFASGFVIQLESIRKAFQPPGQFNALDEQSALKVDFWILDRADPFAVTMFDRRKRLVLFDHTTWIITPEDLILQKLRWNQITPSERQVLDAAGVYELQRSTMDEAYLSDWSARLGIRAELELLRSGTITPKRT